MWPVASSAGLRKALTQLGAPTRDESIFIRVVRSVQPSLMEMSQHIQQFLSSQVLSRQSHRMGSMWLKPTFAGYVFGTYFPGKKFSHGSRRRFRLQVSGSTGVQMVGN